MKYFWRRFLFFLGERWIAITVTLVVVVLTALTIIGMSMMDSYARINALATMPLWVLVMLISGVIHAFIYISMMFGRFSQMRNARVKKNKSKVRFDDVIGLEEAKEEAFEVVELIKDRALLHKIGGKVLRGILLSGPPGCGKTFLAKAIATEAGIPFLSLSGSEFVETFVGVGASRIRKLFLNARKLAHANGGCIVFIDEIDAVGRSRTFSFGGGQETNSTLNQLLVAMDGLSGSDENVIVIGATNAAEGVLDAALLRPGRFDRKIYVDKPNQEGREKVFAYYMKKVRCAEGIDIARLARSAVAKSPADIENMIKEAALIAARKKKSCIDYKDLSEALERIELGIKNRRKMTPREREMTAYHEAGHLIATYLLHPNDDVFKASIVSRRNTLGVVYHRPREELFSHDRNHLLANIKVALAGFAAEKVRFGVTTTGVSSDFHSAMAIAHNMVWRIGMGLSGRLGDYDSVPSEQLSETVKQRLNEETHQILQKCGQDVERLLKREITILDRFAQELLAKDELEYDEIEAIFGEYGKQPVRL